MLILGTGNSMTAEGVRSRKLYRRSMAHLIIAFSTAGFNFAFLCLECRPLPTITRRDFPPSSRTALKAFSVLITASAVSSPCKSMVGIGLACNERLRAGNIRH